MKQFIENLNIVHKVAIVLLYPVVLLISLNTLLPFALDPYYAAPERQFRAFFLIITWCYVALFLFMRALLYKRIKLFAHTFAVLLISLNFLSFGMGCCDFNWRDHTLENKWYWEPAPPKHVKNAKYYPTRTTSTADLDVCSENFDALLKEKNSEYIKISQSGKIRFANEDPRQIPGAGYRNFCFLTTKAYAKLFTLDKTISVPVLNGYRFLEVKSEDYLGVPTLQLYYEKGSDKTTAQAPLDYNTFREAYDTLNDYYEWQHKRKKVNVSKWPKVFHYYALMPLYDTYLRYWLLSILLIGAFYFRAYSKPSE